MSIYRPIYRVMLGNMGIHFSKQCHIFVATYNVYLCICNTILLLLHVEAKFTFEIYRSENYFYCRHSYIARYDERIRFNGKANDRCAADRELEIRGALARWGRWGL